MHVQIYQTLMSTSQKEGHVQRFVKNSIGIAEITSHTWCLNNTGNIWSETLHSYLGRENAKYLGKLQNL